MYHNHYWQNILLFMVCAPYYWIKKNYPYFSHSCTNSLTKCVKVEFCALPVTKLWHSLYFCILEFKLYFNFEMVKWDISNGKLKFRQNIRPETSVSQFTPLFTMISVFKNWTCFWTYFVNFDRIMTDLGLLLFVSHSHYRNLKRKSLNHSEEPFRE